MLRPDGFLGFIPCAYLHRECRWVNTFRPPRSPWGGSGPKFLGVPLRRRENKNTRQHTHQSSPEVRRVARPRHVLVCVDLGTPWGLELAVRAPKSEGQWRDEPWDNTYGVSAYPRGLVHSCSASAPPPPCSARPSGEPSSWPPRTLALRDPVPGVASPWRA